MNTSEMKTVARLILRVLDSPDDEAEIGRVRGDVHALARRFPLYAKRLAATREPPAGGARRAETEARSTK